MGLSIIAKTEVSSGIRSCLLLVALLVISGLLAIQHDSSIQPSIVGYARETPLRAVAEQWQKLGATLGIVLFLLASLGGTGRIMLRTALTFIVTISCSGVVVQGLKHIVGRVRPNDANYATIFIGPNLTSNLDSMPSGHTVAAFAMAFALSGRYPKSANLWYLLAAGVAVSRVIVDRHFPSDVLLGAALGIGIGWIVRWSFNRRELHHIEIGE